MADETIKIGYQISSKSGGHKYNNNLYVGADGTDGARQAAADARSVVDQLDMLRSLQASGVSMGPVKFYKIGENDNP